jgi:GNAT superfamily N-acetyltransferase
MWRPAKPNEDDLIVAMCIALNQEDPGEPVSEGQIRHTLAALRAAPVRGRAVVADVDEEVVAYALLISFWSNEYGGEICAIDELYVTPSHRGRGIATRLFEAIVTDRSLWHERPVALELEVTPDNARARAFYERLGFRSRNQTLRRRVVRPSSSKTR